MVNMNIIKCISKYAVLLVISNLSSFMTMIPHFLIGDDVDRYFAGQSLVIVDVLINSYCIYCTFEFAHYHYEKYCFVVDACCVSCCLYGVLCRITDDKVNVENVRQMVYSEHKRRKTSQDPSSEQSSTSTLATTKGSEPPSQNQQMEDGIQSDH